MRLMLQLLPVLSYLHSRGVIHGNISPDSLILRQQDQLPILINYGLVRDLVARLQLHPVSPEDARGRWGYTPPEKVNGGKGYPSSDLYALAVTAIVLLTGKTAEELYNESSQSFEWGQGGMVNPKFARILRQMLEPRPQKRFASADQVFQALEPVAGLPVQPPAAQAASDASPSHPAPPPAPKYAANPTSAQPIPPAASSTASDLDPTQAPIQAPAQDPAQDPAQPVPATVLQSSGENLPEPRKRVRKKRSSSDPRASAAMVMGLALLVGVIGWKVLSSNRSQPKAPDASPSIAAVNPDAQSPATQNPAAQSPAAPSEPPPTRPATSPSSAKKPSAEKSVKQEALAPNAGGSLRDRLRKLEVDNQVFTNLTDEVFYAKYPQYKNQKGGGKTDQGKTRWNETASNLMDKLETLSPESRKKIGAYQRTDYDQWLMALGEAGAKDSPTLDALADGRFFKWFPDQKGKQLNPRTMGQVWYAIAADQLDAAKAKKAAQPKQPSKSKS
jgi:serine/threonine-protein kinase